MKRKGAVADKQASVALFARVNPKTREWLDREVYRTGHFLGTVIDAVIASVKTKKGYQLDEREMKTLNKAKTQYENRLKRYRQSATKR